MELKTLDIFCEIIDNYGDIGVVYRVAKELKKVFFNSKIRVFLNRLDEFKRINSSVIDSGIQTIDSIEYITFDYLRENSKALSTSQVIIEAFGCKIPEEYMAIAYDHSDLLINLEYLSAEDWIEDFHLQSSPLGQGKLKKIFFMPGFTEKSGGIIADSNYLERAKKVAMNKKEYRDKYLADIENIDNKIVGTLFSYEKNFIPLIEDLQKFDKEVVLLALGEKTQESLRKILKNFSIEHFRNSLKYGKIEIRFLEFLNQEEYEELINLVDFNFVRGEDSFIRAVLTGKPYMWHIYCQEEFAHLDKIEGFLDKYRKVIQEFADEEFLDNMEKFFKDYNFRKENNLELGKESYLYFFENLAKIERYNTIFRDFLIQKCNLINKLKIFIEKY
ncbi:elongation factor P maturation arginine rhamnosyltransferase EarP [Fusobacterium sp. SYSU M8A802]